MFLARYFKFVPMSWYGRQPTTKTAHCRGIWWSSRSGKAVAEWKGQRRLWLWNCEQRVGTRTISRRNIPRRVGPAITRAIHWKSRARWRLAVFFFYFLLFRSPSLFLWFGSRIERARTPTTRFPSFGIRVEHPPRAFAIALVLYSNKLAVQGQVVANWILQQNDSHANKITLEIIAT